MQTKLRGMISLSAKAGKIRSGADAVRAAFGDVNFLARAGAPAKETAFLTGPMTRSQVESRLAGMEKCSLFRVLD